MSLDKIQQLVGSLAKSVEDNERIATPVLAAKLSKAVDAYPGDQTIGAMSRVIGKMAANSTMFIRRAELKALYSKLYSNNTKFAEVFKDELGELTPLASPTYAPRDESSTLNQYQVGDAILANALNSVFDKHAPLKMYSQDLANKALASAASTLDAWNLRPTSLTVSDGNDKFLVIQANYETPKGVTSFFIPVEIHNNKVVEASVFMGNAGPQELNHSSIKAYLNKSAGNKLKIDGTSILGVLTNAATEKRVVSDAEIALTKLTASRQGKSEFFQNSIIGQKVSEASKKDISTPRLAEADTFEAKFSTVQGQATWKFGEVVNKGIEHIARELKGYGHKNPQITIAKTDDTTIFYNVALDAGRVGFVVPVKVASGKLVKPSVILCNGTVSSFSQEGINELYVKNASDFRAAAGASYFSGMKPSEVLQNLRTALAEGNHTKAEDALNVLANSGDTKAYATGFSIYMAGLAPKQAEAQVKCAHASSTKHSEHPICSQTGLPVHKVYQDKDGNCRPLYRRGMDETYEGAVFNNSKIFG
jgi:hypothetical protein